MTDSYGTTVDKAITLTIRGQHVKLVYEVAFDQWKEIDYAINGGHGKGRRPKPSKGTKDIVTLVRESMRHVDV